MYVMFLWYVNEVQVGGVLFPHSQSWSIISSQIASYFNVKQQFHKSGVNKGRFCAVNHWCAWLYYAYDLLQLTLSLSLSLPCLCFTLRFCLVVLLVLSWTSICTKADLWGSKSKVCQSARCIRETVCQICSYESKKCLNTVIRFILTVPQQFAISYMFFLYSSFLIHTF